MNPEREIASRALRAHREEEAKTLERVTAEALRPELLPEGSDPREDHRPPDGYAIVDGQLVPTAPKRPRRTLSVRW